VSVPGVDPPHAARASVIESAADGAFMLGIITKPTMSIDARDRRALEQIEIRMLTLLPEEYHDSYEDRLPAAMRSAGLEYDASGKVAWNEIWSSFCDLAIAGGPPHKGRLLEPATSAEIDAAPDSHRAVVAEIVRGIGLATDLVADESPLTGWVRVQCVNQSLAGWLLRMIVTENVSAHGIGAALDLPAGPGYRLDKEVKNVVTVIAKTTHYWFGHMPRVQREAIAILLDAMGRESPLVTPAMAESDDDRVEPLRSQLGAAIRERTGLQPSTRRYRGWLGLDCGSVRLALWLMRALVTVNVLARREDATVFVPVNASLDPEGDVVLRSVARVRHLAQVRGIA
jgi:hypothetical protein